MAREVNTVLVLFDRNGSQLKSIEMSKNAIVNENSYFLVKRVNLSMNPSGEVVDDFIKDLIIYHLIFQNCDLSELAEYVPDIESFLEEFNYLYDSMQEKFPNRFNKISSELDYCTIYKGVNINIYGSLYDFDYKQVTFALSSEDGEYDFQKYPLIPEYAEKIYRTCMHFENLTVIENKLNVLHSSIVFFDLMYEETNDTKYKKMKQDVEKVLEETLEDAEEQYIEYSNNVKKNLSYKVFETASACNDIYMFGNYVITELIESKKLNVITDLKNVLLKLKVDEPNYKALADEISMVLLFYNLEDEQHFYQKIRNEQSDVDIMEALLLVISSWVVRKEYRDLVKEVSGESRTQE